MTRPHTSTPANPFSRLIARARRDWDLIRSDEQIEADQWLAAHFQWELLPLEELLDEQARLH